MTAVLVILGNDRKHESISIALNGMGTVHAQNRIVRWLTRAAVAAGAEGKCVSFTVAVHCDGPACDHEVQS